VRILAAADGVAVGEYVATDPRGVLLEFGVELPKNVEIRVWDSTSEIRYLVVPMRPAATDTWSEERLADLVTRESMIGTGLPKQIDEVAR
jgi:nitrile hydratase